MQLKIYSLLLILLIIVPLDVAAEKKPNNGNAKLVSMRDDLWKLYYLFDQKAYFNYLNKIDSLKEVYPKNAYVFYYSGLARLNLGKILYNPNPDKAYDLFAESVDDLIASFEIEKSQEVAALISSAYGKKSSLSGIKAVFWGMKSKSWIYDAYDFGGYNPKLNLIAATHLMHLPSFYGGDKKRARQMLEDAIKMNDTLATQDTMKIPWAKNAELYAYLAQLEILEEHPAEARKYMQLSLQLVPDYGFVKIDLENQLKKLKEK